mgnify:CR=1 FL=1
MLCSTGWRVEWLAVLIEWPRRASVYAEIDATFREYDLATEQQRKTWELQKLHFQSLAPPEQDRMKKSSWVAYRAAKEAAELEYGVFTKRAFDKMHYSQARIISSALGN